MSADFSCRAGWDISIVKAAANPTQEYELALFVDEYASANSELTGLWTKVNPEPSFIVCFFFKTYSGVRFKCKHRPLRKRNYHCLSRSLDFSFSQDNLIFSLHDVSADGFGLRNWFWSNPRLIPFLTEKDTRVKDQVNPKPCASMAF